MTDFVASKFFSICFSCTEYLCKLEGCYCQEVKDFDLELRMIFKKGNDGSISESLK